jgi:hypothetical protein
LRANERFIIEHQYFACLRSSPRNNFMILALKAVNREFLSPSFQ